MLFIIVFIAVYSRISFTFSFAIHSSDSSLSNYAKVSRWGQTGTSYEYNGENKKETSSQTPWNHRSEDHPRKLSYAMNDRGVTYYYSKEIPKLDEKRPRFPDTGVVSQNPDNHKSYFHDYYYKSENYPNAKIDEDVDIKPPAENKETFSDYSKYNSDAYNSPFTSYNPPKTVQQTQDYEKYPPLSDDNSGSNPSPINSKVPLSEIYGAPSSSDDTAEVDSYNTPKPPKGSIPVPVPVYGPPVIDSKSPNSDKQTKQKIYKFPEPFPVPHVIDSNDQTPPGTSYGAPVVGGGPLKAPLTKKLKVVSKKKPVNTYKLPFNMDDGELTPDDEIKEHKLENYPSAPMPFHPPLQVPDEEEANFHNSDNHHGSIFAPPPLDDEEDEEDEKYAPHPPLPSKPKKIKHSHGNKHHHDEETPAEHENFEENPIDEMYIKNPSPDANMDTKPPSSHMSDSGMDYAPKSPPMAEGDLSPPPEDQYEHGHQFNYGPHDYDHDHDHDHHVYHEVKTTTSKPDHRANYSYYFLGRKLWYIPLYFSIYFIVYITILIIKSIARHKIQLVNQFDYTTASSRMSRELEIIDDVHSNFTSSLANVEKKYM